MRILVQSRQLHVLALAVCVLSFCSLAMAASRPRSHAPAKTGEAADDDDAPKPTGHVTDIRFWSQSDATRIAIEVDSEFQFRSDKLNNPERVFFDIVGAKPQHRKGVDIIAVGDGFVKQIRVAETQPGTTRVVLDLSSTLEFQTSRLSNPERLIIELRLPGKTPAVRPPIETTKVFQPPAQKAAATVETVLIPKIEPPARTAAKVETPALLAKYEPPRLTYPKETIVAKDPPMPRETTASMRETTPRETSAHTPPMPVGTPAMAAKRVGNGESSMTRVLGLKLGRIVVDAGHGGHDAGTSGPGGLLEKDLVLDVARRLGALLESKLGSEIIYTRSDDTFIPLEQRPRIANENRADLFISIHANSSPVRNISGVETYYLNFTTSKTALEVAARENATAESSISDLKDLVQKIALKDKVDESREFAAKVQNSLAVLSTKANSQSKDRGVKKAPFVVLIGASMPAILAEIGFVTNARDESQMKKPEYRQKIAEALSRGVIQYASGLSHFQVARRSSAAPQP